MLLDEVTPIFGACYVTCYVVFFFNKLQITCLQFWPWIHFCYITNWKWKIFYVAYKDNTNVISYFRHQDNPANLDKVLTKQAEELFESKRYTQLI